LEHDVITYEKFTQHNNTLGAMLKDASEDEFLGDVVYQRMTPALIEFKSGSELVGFAIPRLEQGFFRVGPIYVDPKWRGKGVATDFLKSFFEHRSGRAYIEPNNTASKKSFEAAGCRYTGKVYVKGPERYLQSEKRVSKSLSW